MLKVKEYLDKNFFIKDSKQENNGVFGEWSYPHPHNLEYFDFEFPGWKYEKLPRNIIFCSCNNQTMIFRITINENLGSSLYHYLQTYQHIPRGLPDKNGYYARSTDDEVIKYIKNYKKIIDRELKLKRILKK